MPTRATKLIPSGLAALAMAAFALTAVSSAHAEREHEVQSGQNLARIAQRYHVDVAQLAAANQLRRNGQLRPGMVLRIPDEGVAYVGRGQTLASIARDNDCSVADLMRINRIRSANSLRVGQRIVLPGHEAAVGRSQAASRWGRSRHPGVVTLNANLLHRRERVRLVDRRGRATRGGIAALQRMMRPRPGLVQGRVRSPAPPARLVEIVAAISDHFGGRTVHIHSGYRPSGGNTSDESRHTRGRALDLHVEGVPEPALRDFVRTINRLGVGYYPRSVFVHIDLRERDSYWVDWSRPGQRPRYQRRGQPAPTDATPEELENLGF